MNFANVGEVQRKRNGKRHHEIQHPIFVGNTPGIRKLFLGKEADKKLLQNTFRKPIFLLKKLAKKLLSHRLPLPVDALLALKEVVSQ